MSTTISAHSMGEQLEQFLRVEAARITADGLEAHASLLRGVDSATVGLEVCGPKCDAELTIELTEDGRGVHADAAIIAADGRRLLSFDPVTLSGARANQAARRLAAEAALVLEMRLAFTSS